MRRDRGHIGTLPFGPDADGDALGLYVTGQRPPRSTPSARAFRDPLPGGAGPALPNTGELNAPAHDRWKRGWQRDRWMVFLRTVVLSPRRIAGARRLLLPLRAVATPALLIRLIARNEREEQSEDERGGDDDGEEFVPGKAGGVQKEQRCNSFTKRAVERVPQTQLVMYGSVATSVTSARWHIRTAAGAIIAPAAVLSAMDSIAQASRYLANQRRLCRRRSRRERGLPVLSRVWLSPGKRIISQGTPRDISAV